ncbi:hypothetical protein TSAR_015188 [Trichomalopsis sarcophagae]|uniref:Lysosomal protein NCU-G1 n=1 Tax=Trichomalopsis sarcophagae TaxID=543379 RepID=A0A232F7S5_9HYME|nr:hypothetical protein TSAR_015188 [Trichomalopsis sarcophagae]
MAIAAKRGVFCVLGAVCVLLAIVGSSNCLERTLEYAFNEDCKELCKHTKVRIAHVRAVGPNDTLHYLWDFTENPTILIAVTSHTAKLQIDWKKYLSRTPNSLDFTEKPLYTFGVAIERILEFNDFYNTSRIDEVNDKNITEINFENFQWHHENMTKHDNLVQFYTYADSYKDQYNNVRSGNISFLMHGFGTVNHSNITPRMLHSENATQVDIVFDHLQVRKDFLRSRLALEFLVVSEISPNFTLNVDTKRKLDDEFTPGIFEVMDLSTPVINERSAYLQWRPVSYTDELRDVTDSVGSIFYPVKKATVDDYFNKNNLLYMYYGENLFNNLVQRMNVSLGAKGENYYKESQYATWTFIAGYGTPPDERFSVMVMLIISIGVGVPMILIMTLGIWACLRRKNPS